MLSVLNNFMKKLLNAK